MRLLLISLLILCSALSKSASANLGDFGFGSRSAALGGASAAWGFDGYAAYSNPAGLPVLSLEERKIILSYGIVWLNPSFIDIKNVIIENNFTSDRIRFGDVDTSYRDTLGQYIGLAFKLAPEFHNLTAGATMYFPFEQLSYVDSGEPFIPEYFLYRSRYARPQVELGLGAQFSPRFFVGGGLHFSYGLTGNGTAFLQTDQARSSSLRLVATLKPKAAPYFGFLLSSKDANLNLTDSPSPGTWTLGLVFRFPVKAPSGMAFNTSARAFGSSAAIDFTFNSASTLLYDPLSVEAGWSWQHGARGRLYLQLDYQRWSVFEGPALVVNPRTDICGGSACSPLAASRYPSFGYRDIFIPRIGEEFAFDRFTLRGGYAYRPSILTGLSNGPGNYLDPPKHMMSAGVGFKFKHFFGFNTPSNLDLHGTYQALATQKVEKLPGDETGAGSGNQKIGAPGYSAGGKIYGGGISFTVGF